jgi:hypothetical protein
MEGIVCKIRALVKAGSQGFYVHDKAFGDQKALGFRIWGAVGLNYHMAQKPGIIILGRHGDDVSGVPDKPGFFDPHLITQGLGT